jgi:hypothetical protein
MESDQKSIILKGYESALPDQFKIGFFIFIISPPQNSNPEEVFLC